MPLVQERLAGVGWDVGQTESHARKREEAIARDARVVEAWKGWLALAAPPDQAQDICRPR